MRFESRFLGPRLGCFLLRAWRGVFWALLGLLRVVGGVLVAVERNVS